MHSFSVNTEVIGHKHGFIIMQSSPYMDPIRRTLVYTVGIWCQTPANGSVRYVCQGRPSYRGTRRDAS